VAKFPSFRRAWRNLGLIHVKQASSKEGHEAQDEYDAAIRAFTRMIELGGADAYSYGLLGFAYTAKQDFLPAEASYRNALLLQPENTEWRLGLTRCVFKQQKFEDAVALLDVLLARYPEKAEFWQLQAQAFLGLKQPLRAAQNLEVVDRLGKATPDNLHTLGDIYVTENLMDLAAGAYRRALERDPAQPTAKILRDVELLAARSAPAQARQLSARVQEVLGTNLVDADRRRCSSSRRASSMAEGGGTSETARGARGDRAHRSARRRRADAARPLLRAPERARPRNAVVRARREHRGLRGQRPRSTTRRSWSIEPLRRGPAAPAPRAGAQAARGHRALPRAGRAQREDEALRWPARSAGPEPSRWPWRSRSESRSSAPHHDHERSQIVVLRELELGLPAQPARDGAQWKTPGADTASVAVRSSSVSVLAAVAAPSSSTRAATPLCCRPSTRTLTWLRASRRARARPAAPATARARAWAASSVRSRDRRPRFEAEPERRARHVRHARSAPRGRDRAARALAARPCSCTQPPSMGAPSSVTRPRSWKRRRRSLGRDRGRRLRRTSATRAAGALDTSAGSVRPRR
jgi:tetratricopeptide (TPR) repeat protein